MWIKFFITLNFKFKISGFYNIKKQPVYENLKFFFMVQLRTYFIYTSDYFKKVPWNIWMVNCLQASQMTNSVENYASHAGTIAKTFGKIQKFNAHTLSRQKYDLKVIWIIFHIILWNYAIHLWLWKLHEEWNFNDQKWNLICHFENRRELYHTSDLLKGSFIWQIHVLFRVHKRSRKWNIKVVKVAFTVRVNHLASKRHL